MSMMALVLSVYHLCCGGIISVSSRVDLAPLSVVRKYTYDHLGYWLEVVFGLGCGEVAL